MVKKTAGVKGEGVVIVTDEAEIRVYKCKAPRLCSEQHYKRALERHSSWDKQYLSKSFP